MSQELPSSAQVAAMRRDYMQHGLDEKDAERDPFQQFANWFQNALDCPAIREANAMVLSTVSAEGNPHARYVLLKGFDANGFIFFTNYSSEKGKDLAVRPLAALTFGWIELERQVRIEGTVSKTPRAAVEDYFKTRPRGSRLGAWASSQSEVIPSRTILEERLAEADAKFPDAVPPPETWGGYLVIPQQFEFWQGRTNRLHDRLRYRKDSSGWLMERLAP